MRGKKQLKKKKHTHTKQNKNKTKTTTKKAPTNLQFKKKAKKNPTKKQKAIIYEPENQSTRNFDETRTETIKCVPWQFWPPTHPTILLISSYV